MAKDVIIALDFPTKEDTLAFLDLFTDEKPFVKIGMELFYAEGPDIVREIKARGHRIFLDLKLHDIPNTVKSAMAVLAGLDVDMTNVHVSGTKMMMEWALEGLRSGGRDTILIGVTQLTSTDEKRMNEEILIPGKMEDVVASYARLAKEAGLQGVVCSPLEAGIVKEACGEDFMTVTPGIRFGGAMICDQTRITTP
ncbi:MAG: orotidine-5'-phosphate decarboxylase, partial [Firmicutes bacterium]|nr:orotidine-5'-phosphate decarboxylase [Bacillota bacterium]